MKRKLLSVLTVCAVMFAMIVAGYPKSAVTLPKNVHAAANYANDDIAAYAYQVAAIVNRERSANGLAPLKYSEELSNAAIVRAQEIQTYFSHTRPNGSRCFTAITERGITYRSAGENIAYGQRNPEAVMTAWMNSSGHRANILSADYEYIGIGVTYRNGVYYWSQFFAKSNDLTGEVITDGSLSGTAPTPTTTAKPAVVTTTKAAPAVTTTKTVTTAVTTKKPETVTTATEIVTSAEPTVTTTAVTVTKPAVTTTVIVSGGNNSCGMPDLDELLKMIKDRLGIDLGALLKK